VTIFESHPEIRWGINFLAVFGVIVALALGKPLFVPLVVALMLAAVCWPVVEMLRVRWWLPQGVAAIVVMVGLVLAVTLGVMWLVVATQSNFQALNTYDGRQKYYLKLHDRFREDISEELANQLFPIPAKTPESTKALDEGHKALLVWLNDRETKARDEGNQKALDLLKTDRTRYERDGVIPPEAPAEIIKKLAEGNPPIDTNKSVIFGWVNRQFSLEGNALPNLLFTTGELSMVALLVLFLALFLWIDGEMLARRTAEIFGPQTGPYFGATLRALEEMAKQVRAYLVWRTLINLFITLIMGVVYSGMGLQQPWTWAILAGVMGYVPYIGHVVAAIPAMFDGFVNGNFTVVVWIVSIYGVVLLIEGYVIYPLVVGRHMEMNATTTIIACLFWQLVWGGIGLFLAMPLTAGIKAICANVPLLRPWANLMGQHELAPLDTNGEIWPDPQPGYSTNGQNGQQMSVPFRRDQ
jgi:predicted PurR-regulated permease PerM